MPPRLRLTVGLVGPFPPTVGGMAVQAERLAAGLRAAGVGVVAVPTSRPWPGLLHPLRRIPGLRTAITAGLFLLGLAGAVGRVDLFHVLAASHLAFYLFTVPTVVAARLWRRRVVVNYRGGDAQRFFARRRRALAWLRRADRLVVPSGFLREVFAAFGVEAAVVPNIAELDRFRYRERGALVPRILVTRHLEPWYNVALAVRAFERVRASRPAATLTIVGAGPQRRALERMVAERQLQGVTFVGAVPAERMPDFYDQCELALNPTNVDNMPISVLEAFASGLVVVSTAVGGVPYLVADGRTGYLVPADDAEAMAEKVVWLCEHPQEAAATARRARDACRAYDWSQVRRQWLALYAEIGFRGPGPGARFPGGDGS